MHLGMAECHVLFTHHCDLKLDLWPSIKNIHVWSISLILFELVVPNLVCECILGWRSVPFQVTVTLASDLVSRISIKSGAYLLYSLR